MKTRPHAFKVERLVPKTLVWDRANTDFVTSALKRLGDKPLHLAAF